MLKYDFKCEICQGKFDSELNIPRVLQCGHTICSKCVERMKQKNITRCPFDRKIIDPDDDKIAINYYILHLIDGSIKDSITEIEEKEEIFELKPKPVVNSPGWKNTLDGFIHGDILYTVESNGFIYCTDLNSGEWWFLYLNVFYGKFFFKNCNDIKNFFPKMFMIDQYGNLFQMFNKNYYTQFGKKGSWKNTTFLTVFKNKMYSLETSEKLYETDLTTGVWREIIPIAKQINNNILNSNNNIMNNINILNVENNNDINYNLKVLNLKNTNNHLSGSNSSNINNPNNINNNNSENNSEVSEINLHSSLPIIDTNLNSRNRANSNNSNNLNVNMELLDVRNNIENEFEDNYSNNGNLEDEEEFNNGQYDYNGNLRMEDVNFHENPEEDFNENLLDENNYNDNLDGNNIGVNENMIIEINDENNGERINSEIRNNNNNTIITSNYINSSTTNTTNINNRINEEINNSSSIQIQNLQITETVNEINNVNNIINNENNNSSSINSSNSNNNNNENNNNGEIRQNRFLNVQDNRRFDIELSDSSSNHVRNANNINNNNLNTNINHNIINSDQNILNNNNNNNTNNMINNIRNINPSEVSNITTPIKTSINDPSNKNIQQKLKALNPIKKPNYNFSNAVAIFSTSENLFFVNKKGEVFTINENTGEINLETKNFSKNIECFATNSTHIYFFEKDGKHIYRASIDKNFESEQEEKILNLNKLEIEKKIFSDFKEENIIFLANNNYNKLTINTNSNFLEDKKAIKKYSFESNEPLLNISNNYICRNCKCTNIFNNEENKNEEKISNNIFNKEQEGIIFNKYSESFDINNKNNLNLVSNLKNEFGKPQINVKNNNNVLNKSNILLENNFIISNNNKEAINNFSKFIEKEKEKSFTNNILNHSDNLGYFNNNKINVFSCNNNINNSNNDKSLFLNPKKISFNLSSSYLKIEKFHELEDSIIPTKLICDDNKLIIIDKNGELNKLEISNKKTTKFQCLFMLRNCHLNNSVLIGDGDLILLDPVRLSLNKLNIITGTEIIILHSVKFLSSIKFLFTNNSKIYFIDTSGNLYNFNEFDKKIMQIGSNGLCKYILDFTVHKNFLFTIENNSSLYRTNLNDGIYKEYKVDYVKNYSHFLSDHQYLIFITKDDMVNILIPSNEELTLKKQFKFDNISKYTAVTYFKKQIIFYNQEKKTIESIDVNQEEIKTRVLVENFGEVLSFINNNDCLACIIKDCVIYKLYC